MTTSMYCLYVGVDYTYIDINALALYVCVCMYVCVYVCMYVLMYDYIYVLFVCRR